MLSDEEGESGSDEHDAVPEAGLVGQQQVNDDSDSEEEVIPGLRGVVSPRTARNLAVMTKDFMMHRQLDTLFHDLIHECRHSPPGARLSAKLRTALEKHPPATRRLLVSRQVNGSAPLFVCARRGNAELAEYLVHVMDAPLEQRGVYESPDERALHRVTPLWCAAVAGKLAVLKVLADAGADLDAASDSGSTPVRSACFMTHEAIVQELVDRGADIHRANHNGGTCLINSVQSAKLCSFLLSRGARVDAQDLQLKSALHYAAQEQRADTARLLLEHGANPHLTSRSGDDVLRTAALKGSASIVPLLFRSAQYSAARRADALELLGATQLDDFNDMYSTLHNWRKAADIRYSRSRRVEKGSGNSWWAVGLFTAEEARRVGGMVREWRSHEELERVAGDLDAMRMQALLIVDRVLGKHHRDTIFRLMYRGASYADSSRYQECIELWSWALEARIEKDTLLYTEAKCLLEMRPVCKKQAETFDRMLRCITHLLYLLVDTAETQHQKDNVVSMVRELVSLDVRSYSTNDTLLHLSVTRLNVIRSTYFADDELTAPKSFPSVSVTRLLLQCGASVTALNYSNSTALHIAAIPNNYVPELLEELLEAGGHLDQLNLAGESALSLTSCRRDESLFPLRYTTLCCLSARALVSSPETAHLAHLLPDTLAHFLRLHQP